ncbi:MAG: hypothetical protein WCG67_03980, partial [Ferruginibacter sp.]
MRKLNELTDVLKKITEWRANKKRKNEPFPDELAKLICQLRKSYKRAEINKALFLSDTSWKSKKFKKFFDTIFKKLNQSIQMQEIKVPTGHEQSCESL